MKEILHSTGNPSSLYPTIPNWDRPILDPCFLPQNSNRPIAAHDLRSMGREYFLQQQSLGTRRPGIEFLLSRKDSWLPTQATALSSPFVKNTHQHTFSQAFCMATGLGKESCHYLQICSFYQELMKVVLSSLCLLCTCRIIGYRLFRWRITCDVWFCIYIDHGSSLRL